MSQYGHANNACTYVIGVWHAVIEDDTTALSALAVI